MVSSVYIAAIVLSVFFATTCSIPRGEGQTLTSATFTETFTPPPRPTNVTFTGTLHPPPPPNVTFTGTFTQPPRMTNFTFTGTLTPPPNITHTRPVAVTPTTTSALTTTSSTATTATTSKDGCLIATAAYESELSPEVQFLRSFRDAKILNTYAGKEFMGVFNTFYYSFSPTVADWIRSSEAFKAVSKALLCPLISSLRVAAQTYESLAFNLEIAAIGAGLVASTMIGAIYVSPIITLATRRRHVKIKRPALMLGLALLVGLGFIAAAESLLVGPLMAVGTAVLVLSVLGLSSLLTSRALSLLFHLKIKT